MKVAVLYNPSLSEHGRCIGDRDAIPWEGYEKRILDWFGPSDHPAKDRYDFTSGLWTPLPDPDKKDYKDLLMKAESTDEKIEILAEYLGLI